MMAKRAEAAGDVGGEADEQPTVADLQRNWHDEIALVKKLRGQGLAEGHPAMRAACEARDAAERAWRGSKEPAPASIRLGRAQGKLDRAVTLQAVARQAMLEAEKEHRARMATLQSNLDECTDRVRLRRQQLRDIQVELGAGRPLGVGAQRAQQDAIRQVHGTICGEVGPTIAALVEQLDSDAPAWSTLNGLLGKLAASKDALEKVAAQSADQFDIGDDGNDQWESWSNWSESHDVRGQPWGYGETGHRETGDPGDGGDADQDMDGDGQWAGDRGYDAWCGGARGDGEQDRDQSMGTDNWWDSPSRRWGGTVRWQAGGHGKWTRSSWADQLEEEHGNTEGEDSLPPAARRRLDTVEESQVVEAEAQQQRQGSPSQPPVPRGAAGGPACEDPEERKRRHNERVNNIITMAVEVGVTPLTSTGEELQLLDANQLDAWVAECLPAALLC